jgi:hypothetical protein
MVILDVKRSEKKNEFLFETTVKACRGLLLRVRGHSKPLSASI